MTTWLKQSTAVEIKLGPYLLDMCPSSSLNDLAYVSALESKHVSNRLMSHPGISELADLAYRFIGKLCGVVPLAFLSSMARHVSTIVLGCSPIQIFNPIVSCYSVAVAGFMSGRARAYEHFQHKMVEVTSVAAPQSNHLSLIDLGAGGSQGCGFQLSPRLTNTPFSFVCAPGRAVRADAVAGMPRNFSVFNHESVVSNMGRARLEGGV